MFPKKSFVAFILAITLLVAPATMAGPSTGGGHGWMAYISATFADVVSFFRFDRAKAPADLSTTGKPRVSNVCGDMGGLPDPNGCP